MRLFALGSFQGPAPDEFSRKPLYRPSVGLTDTDELDSYMYQTVGHDAIHLIAEAMGLPLYRRVITGTAVNQAAEYGSRQPGGSYTAAGDNEQASSAASTSARTATGDVAASEAAPLKKDETEDLHELLLTVKQHHPDVEGVSVGAILSNYQRVRVEHIALRPEIGMVPLAYLWQRNQHELLDEMVRSELRSMLIKVAGAGLDERDLGKDLAVVRPKLHRLVSSQEGSIGSSSASFRCLTNTIRPHNSTSSTAVMYAERAESSRASPLPRPCSTSRSKCESHLHSVQSYRPG